MSRRAAPATLVLDGVHKRFGTFAAVTDVSEEFAAGELISVIGPNGAGKSTLLNMICGTLPVTEGAIRLGDVALDGRSPEGIAALGIARKFQVPSVFESLTVIDNLRLAAPRDADGRRVEALLADIRLLADRDTRAGELPHGRKQWLEIGMALAMEPRVLLLDEPTAGLSVNETRDVARFLKDLRGRVTVVVIEHDMAFVRDLGARTVVLHHGRVIASGPFEAIENDETVRDIYLGRL